MSPRVLTDVPYVIDSARSPSETSCQESGQVTVIAGSVSLDLRVLLAARSTWSCSTRAAEALKSSVCGTSDP